MAADAGPRSRRSARSGGASARRAAAVAVAFVAFAWAAVGFARGVHQVLILRERFLGEASAGAVGIRSPWSWRPYTPEVVALRELLGEIDAPIPRGGRVVVPPQPAPERPVSDRLWAWAHVLRADLDFRRPAAGFRAAGAEFWLALGSAPNPPAGERIAVSRAGRLYRMPAAGATGPGAPEAPKP